MFRIALREKDIVHLSANAQEIATAGLSVLHVCKNSPKKIIDDGVTVAIASFPVTEVKKPTEND